jgi:hypothetical protein
MTGPLTPKPFYQKHNPGRNGQERIQRNRKLAHCLKQSPKELPVRLAAFLQFQHTYTSLQRKQDIHAPFDDRPSDSTATDSHTLQ